MLTSVDPKMYGGADLPADIKAPEITVPEVPVSTEVPKVPQGAALLGTALNAQAMQIQEGAQREQASIIASVGAAFTQSSIADAYSYITKPSFEPDEAPNKAAFLAEVPFTMSTPEREFIQKQTSVKGMQWAVERVQDQRVAQQVMGDHPFAAGITAMGDPGYFAIDMATLQAGKLLRVGRLGSAVAAGAGVAGFGAVVQDEARPMGTQEIIGYSLLNAAAQGMFYKKGAKPGKGALVPKDPDFPAAELHAHAQAGMKIEPALAPDVPVLSFADEVAQARTAGTLSAKGAEFAEWLVSKNPSVVDDLALMVKEGSAEARGSAGRYNPALRLATIFSENASDTTLVHEVLHHAERMMPENIREAIVQAHLNEVTTGIVQSTGARRQMFKAIHEAIITPTKEAMQKAKGLLQSTEDYHLLNPSEYWAVKGVDILSKRFNGTAFDAVRQYIREVIEKAKGVFGMASDAPILKALDSVLKGDGSFSTKQMLTGTHEFNAPHKPKAVSNPRPQAGIRPGVPSTPAVAATAVNALLKRTWAQKTGDAIGWNVHKTMAGFGPIGSKIADLLFDNNGNLGITSVESVARGVKADLTTLKWVHDDLLREAMAEDGYGMLKQLFSNKAAAHQAKIETELHREMLRRDQAFRQGRPTADSTVPPRITKMADALDVVYARADKELKAGGVEGADGFKHHTGFANRKWDSLKINQGIDNLVAHGLTREVAKSKIIQMVANSMADATGMDAIVAREVASATINRSLRKGVFEDAVFNANAGSDTAKVVRDMLIEEGLSGRKLQRVLDVLTAQSDEGGKAGFMKHRVDLDYTHTLQEGSVSINITDLLNHNISDIVDKYIDGVGSQVAFARKGYTSTESINKLRVELLDSLKLDPEKQAKAGVLFDESLNHLRGAPTGTDMGMLLRNTAAVNRMISLGASGLWQLTEYATMMAHYGALKTIKYMAAEMPMFKGMLATAASNKQYSQHLKDILTTASEQNLRLRPYLQRFSDGFEMPQSASLSMRLQHAAQLVPMLNGMKYVHGHQARVTANLILDTLSSAANGDAKAATVLAKYGIDHAMLAKLKPDVQAHGMQVDKWANGVWQDVRPGFMKMMDESVLHQRMGDMPEFALLNPVGKFIMTYRGFVLQAHNKILAGGLQRDGFAGVSLMLAYQFPMAALAVQAQNTIAGKKELTMQELAAKAVGQMGGVGLASEIWGAASGTKKSIGAPGLIPFDRASGLVQDVFKGDAPRVAHDAFGLIPLLAIIPPLRATESLVNPQQ